MGPVVRQRPCTATRSPTSRARRSTTPTSMGRRSNFNGSSSTDVGLVGDQRVVWVDAKYKAHLSLLARHGWSGVSETVHDAHRADLHQALAYAALANVDRVDTVLLYPHLGQSDARPPSAVAIVASGRRRVRLVLGALPFGFGTPSRAARPPPVVARPTRRVSGAPQRTGPLPGLTEPASGLLGSSALPAARRLRLSDRLE